MKKLILTIGSALLLAATTVQAAWYTNLVSLNEGVNEAKQLTIAVYPGYAPDLTISGVSKPWGVGLAALYPIGSYSFIGARIDYLGDSFWAPSATVGLQASVTLFGRLHVTPFTIGGVIVPIAGAGSQNGEVGAIVGAGFHANVWSGTIFGKEAGLNIFYAAEHWTIYSGVIHRPGVALTIHF